ncbi:MAG TPA: hypothetical protein PKY82_02120 [Pyrinomonadaceae bacterium]|nr:hypothetical protein [Pyrinomonadaceae bacterium]
MRVFLAGLCCSDIQKWYLKDPVYPKYVLESFYYLEPWLFAMPGFEIENFLMDSGAYTFMAQKKKEKVDWDKYVEKYAETIVKRKIKYFFELDIDNLVGLSEVERLREKLELLTGKKSIPVWHRSRGKQYWLDMIANYQYVAIGGIVTKEIRQKEHPVFSWFLEQAREKNTKVHGLGYTNADGLTKYRFYSVDSTSWIGGRFAILYSFNGERIKQIRNPPNSRMLTYKRVDTHNMKEWIKFQKYADERL